MNANSEDYDEIHVVKEPKCLRISLHLICKRHLPPNYKEWSQEVILEKLNKITHLRLDRENIGQIDNLELLGKSVRNVYFQHNSIKNIENMESLTGLQFLTIASNQISSAEGLRTLESLRFLDLSDNKIEHIDPDYLPSGLIILDLRGNPCVAHQDYKLEILERLPNLRQLDGKELKRGTEEGQEYSSSEDEDDPQLSFREMANGILKRSQQNLENSFILHRKRLSDLEEVRSSSDFGSRGQGSAKSATDSYSYLNF